MKISVFRIGVFSLTLLMATTALAQRQRSWRPEGGVMAPMGDSIRGGLDFAVLLGIEQVQKEIGLTDEQKEKLDSARRSQWDAVRDQFAGLRDMTAEERREAMEGMRDLVADRTAAMRTELEGILTVEQTERLRQIRAQQEGVGVLRRPEIQEQLKMTDAQKDQLRAVAEETQEKTQQLFQDLRAPDADRTGLREKMQELRADAQKKSMAVLNADQRQVFAEKIMGKPFDLDRSTLMRRPQRDPAPR